MQNRPLSHHAEKGRQQPQKLTIGSQATSRWLLGPHSDWLRKSPLPCKRMLLATGSPARHRCRDFAVMTAKNNKKQQQRAAGIPNSHRSCCRMRNGHSSGTGPRTFLECDHPSAVPYLTRSRCGGIARTGLPSAIFACGVAKLDLWLETTSRSPKPKAQDPGRDPVRPSTAQPLGA
jgi:hypothetical protein